MPQSIRSFSVPVCSPNLREYYKDLPVEGIGAVTLWMGLLYNLFSVDQLERNEYLNIVFLKPLSPSASRPNY